MLNTKLTLDESRIEISMKRYKELLDKELFLDCLEETGVDNWHGYGEACRLERKYTKEGEEC